MPYIFGFYQPNNIYYWSKTKNLNVGTIGGK